MIQVTSFRFSLWRVCVHTTCLYAGMYVCIYVCVYLCMYACMHVCMYACMRACIYVSLYTTVSSFWELLFGALRNACPYRLLLLPPWDIGLKSFGGGGGLIIVLFIVHGTIHFFVHTIVKPWNLKESVNMLWTNPVLCTWASYTCYCYPLLTS